MNADPESAATDTRPGARHALRTRAVEWFRQHAYEPNAVPNAVQQVLGGPAMWSEDAVREAQFTPEQRALVVGAFREIKAIYQAAGGRMQQVMTLVEGIGLMPVSSVKWPYQSEEWTAARAMSAGFSYRYPAHLPEKEKLEAELTQAYYVVLCWIDLVRGGLLDASAIYEDDEEDEL